ncbi:MAG: hypothetical protein EXQ81_02150 [Thermoleophilia bacterium]|nr:hypothetical protein [Thermoleophilia bacterium]
MLVILVVGVPAALMWVTLALALYLTVMELREFEPRPHYLWWSWWLLLVVMLHFPAYIGLRVYGIVRKRQARAA